MVDHLNPEPGRERSRTPEPMPAAPDTAADREVAVGPLVGRPTEAVQQWLDGELPAAEARRANPREVQLWDRITEETERRRRMTTPAPLLENVMKAITPAEQQAPGLMDRIKRALGGEK